MQFTFRVPSLRLFFFFKNTSPRDSTCRQKVWSIKNDLTKQGTKRHIILGSSSQINQKNLHLINKTCFFKFLFIKRSLVSQSSFNETFICLRDFHVLSDYKLQQTYFQCSVIWLFFIFSSNLFFSQTFSLVQRLFETGIFLSVKTWRVHKCFVNKLILGDALPLLVLGKQ